MPKAEGDRLALELAKARGVARAAEQVATEARQQALDAEVRRCLNALVKKGSGEHTHHAPGILFVLSPAQVRNDDLTRRLGQVNAALAACKAQISAQFRAGGSSVATEAPADQTILVAGLRAQLRSLEQRSADTQAALEGRISELQSAAASKEGDSEARQLREKVTDDGGRQECVEEFALTTCVALWWVLAAVGSRAGC